MNIVTPFPSININTANVYTETARRDNQLREVIPAPAPSSASNTETKAQSDAEKARLPGNSDDITYNAAGKIADEKSVQQRDESSENAENSEEEVTEQEEQQLKQEEQQLAQEQLQIKELKARDTEVRIHEQAHAAVGGQHAGSPSYEYQRGPDGARYAVGGEVQIDVSEVPGDPQATIDKMQTVRAAALAPAEPSSADRSIAANATQKLAAAQAELTQPENEDDEKNQLEASSADDESDDSNTKSVEKTRDATIEERAGRIANFYQMATSPASQSSFSALS